MPCVDAWWDGTALGKPEIALAVFPQSKAEAAKNRVALAAASTGTRDLLLRPDQIGSFLRQHRDAVVVCYNVAQLHWLVAAHLGSDAEALKVLWAYSQEGRLIDIMLLDQHVRRIAGESCGPQPLAELVMRVAGQAILPEPEIEALVAEAWRRSSEPLNTPLATALKSVVAGTLKSYESLMTRVREIEDCLAGANHFPNVPPAPPPRDVEEKMKAHLDRAAQDALARCRQAGKSQDADRLHNDEQEVRQVSRRSFGPLGVGIDVQGVIALAKPHHPALQVDPQQVEELRARNLDRFKNASRKLHRDSHAHRCFHWCEGPPGEATVDCDAGGFLRYKTRAMQEWLTGFKERLADCHNLPAEIPFTDDDVPSFDVERWGVWASCDRALAAWRDLSRSARVDRELKMACSPQTSHEILPVLRSLHPDLAAFRTLAIPCFRPREGHVFLVGRLPLLKICCYAAVHCDRHVPKRLVDYFFADKDPIEKIAGELYAWWLREAHLGAVDASGTVESPRGASSVENDAHDFINFRQTAPGTYWHWWLLTKAMLETAPLGLHDTLLGVYLEQDYGFDAIRVAEAERLKQVLVEHVIYELQDFLDDGVLYRLASVLGLTVAESVEKLAEKEYPETTDPALRRDLLRKRTLRPVWTTIHEARHIRSASDLPTDDSITEKVLQRRAKTPVGRVVGPAFYTEARRQQMRLAADEVMKSVAYTLVDAGLPLAAVLDNEFVLEVMEPEGTDSLVQHVRELALIGGRRVLRSLAPGCVCERAVAW